MSLIASIKKLSRYSIIIAVAISSLLVASSVQGFNDSGVGDKGDSTGSSGGVCGNNSGGGGGTDLGSPSTCLRWEMTGGGDNASYYCAEWPTPPEPAVTPVPTCSLWVNPTSVTPGGASTLSWNSTNADYTNIHTVLASYSDDIAAASYPPSVTDYNRPWGSAVIHPTYSRTYTVTFYGTGGQCSASVTVNVDTPRCFEGGVYPNCNGPVTPPAAQICPAGSVGDWPACDVVPIGGGNGGGGGGGGGGSCVATAGSQCNSLPNSCQMVNPGTIQCDGTCLATTPSNNLCPGPSILFGDPPNPNIDSRLFNPGSICTINWSATNATSCTIVGPGVNMTGLSGTVTSPPLDRTSTYKVTCYNGTTIVASRLFTCRINPNFQEI